MDFGATRKNAVDWWNAEDELLAETPRLRRRLRGAFDSRAGDPQLHTHEVVSNKVLTVMDGRWRSLDGRRVFASVTGLSAHYNALLVDRLSRVIGVEWELRERGADRNRQWEIVGVSDELTAEFSSRTREIELKKDELIGEYVARRGRMPSPNPTAQMLRAPPLGREVDERPQLLGWAGSQGRLGAEFDNDLFLGRRLRSERSERLETRRSKRHRWSSVSRLVTLNAAREVSGLATCAQPPEAVRSSPELTRSRIATHSTWWVIGKTPMILSVSAILCRQLRS